MAAPRGDLNGRAPEEPDGGRPGVQLPRWHWAYTGFRLADGATHALIPLLPLLRFGAPAWSVPATIAAMNLAAVPASFFWAAAMERHAGVGRRRLAVAGFGIAALALAIMSWADQLGIFLAAAVLFAAFGVATGPAASVLVLESVSAASWSEMTARMSRTTGIAYLLGVIVVTAWGLAGGLRLDVMLLVGAVLSLGASVWAAKTIAASEGPQRRTEPEIRPTPRRFERPNWFPMRLRFAPSLRGLRLANGHPLRLLVAVFLLFVGSTILFAAYPGILRGELGLGVGLILLAQAPSQFVTPFSVRGAARLGLRHGELSAIGTGIGLRFLSLLGLVAGLLWAGPHAIWLLLAAHALMGLGFAVVQVNGACLLARVHRGGRGQGIGSYHAAVGFGSLIGSVLAFVLLASVPVVALYTSAVAVAAAGSFVFWSVARSNQFVPRNEGVAPE